MQYTTITTLTRKADRQRLIRDLGAAISAPGLVQALVIREDAEERSVSIDIKGQGVIASIWLTPRLHPPIVSWHGADRPLAYVTGAWGSVNQFHRRKATSFPEDLNELIGCLVAGLTAARDGTAFRKDDQ